MAKFKILKVQANVDGASTKTAGRPYLTIYTEKVGQGILNTTRSTPRVIHGDGMIDGKTPIKAHPLFTSIMNACGNPDVKSWDLTVPNVHSKTFNNVVGEQIEAEQVARYTEEYDIENSSAADKRQFQYQTLVMDGETVENVFSQANKLPAVVGSQREFQLKLLQNEVNKNNLIGKNDRIVAAGGKGFLSKESIDMLNAPISQNSFGDIHA